MADHRDGDAEKSAPTRILITGANGFVGLHLIAHLLSSAAIAKEAIHIFAAVEPEHVPSATQKIAAALHTAGGSGADDLLTVLGLDICDARATEIALEQAQPQQVYHLAARASGADADRAAVFAVNVAGTRHLLEAASKLVPFPRVIAISTGYVYGDTDPAHPFREEDPVGPLWRYGAYTDSKIEMEQVAKAYRGFVLVARPFAHTGPGQTPTFALPGFARQLARIERGLDPPVLHVGNLDAQRDLLDVRDVVEAYRLLMAQGAVGETYNVANGQPVTMRAALDQLRALCVMPTEVTIDSARLRPADIACSTGDSQRLRHLTGWQPHRSLETTLRDTLNFWRKETAKPTS